MTLIDNSLSFFHPSLLTIGNSLVWFGSRVSKLNCLKILKLEANHQTIKPKSFKPRFQTVKTKLNQTFHRLNRIKLELSNKTWTWTKLNQTVKSLSCNFVVWFSSNRTIGLYEPTIFKFNSAHIWNYLGLLKESHWPYHGW